MKNKVMTMSTCMKFRLGARTLNNEYNRSTTAVDILQREVYVPMKMQKMQSNDET